MSGIDKAYPGAQAKSLTFSDLCSEAQVGFTYLWLAGNWQRLNRVRCALD